MSTLLQAEDPTAICRRALGLAEARARSFSLEDGSSEADEARLRYDQRRRTVLELLDWNFARARVAGQAVVAEAWPEDMPAAWARPPECIRIRGLFRQGCDRPLRHKAEELLYTEDGGPVQIVFTRDRVNASLFPPVFTRALEYLLAADFAAVFARSVNRQEVMLNFFADAMREADQIEAGERGDTEAFAPNDWQAAVTQPWARI
jgi:hypothetical protein